MMDLTKIDKPFGSLDIETKLALHRAFYEGRVIETNYGGGGFEVCFAQTFYHDGIYRLQPEPMRDISLPWAAMNARWKWAARDEDGSVWAYDERPDPGIILWNTDGSCIEVTGMFANFDPGNKPWNESLIRRPDGV